MKKIATLIFVLTALFLIFPKSSVKAVSCPEGTAEEYFNSADVVFRGEVVSANSYPTEFRVSDWLKGESPSSLIKTNNSPFFSPKEGQVWLIFANYQKNEKVLMIPICGGSFLASGENESQISYYNEIYAIAKRKGTLKAVTGNPLLTLSLYKQEIFLLLALFVSLFTLYKKRKEVKKLAFHKIKFPLPTIAAYIFLATPLVFYSLFLATAFGSQNAEAVAYKIIQIYSWELSVVSATNFLRIISALSLIAAIFGFWGLRQNKKYNIPNLLAIALGVIFAIISALATKL